MAGNLLVCGGANAKIEFEKGASPEQRDHPVIAVLSVAKEGKSTTLRYDGNIDFIGAECQISTEGRPLIVFQAYCSGSGCHDMDNFGVIDPKDLRVLLVPNDTNREAAAKILGKPAKEIKNPLAIGNACRKLYRGWPYC
ncbi:hypothetical protein GCM10010970_01910 [Silvimonas iriomotensis]|uniref:Uncharacterized protein n=2 Tax=Silvimonas iriomotensis TaxID=449662 RepID=A0ABQ2P414_9NEIS|nr:hypothetical protein GCM10010970_01910 [Silvimonas iriomotensis]